MAKHDETTLANTYLADPDCYISVGISIINKESSIRRIRNAVEDLPQAIRPDSFEFKYLGDGNTLLRVGIVYQHPRQHFEGYTAIELSQILYKQIQSRLEE